MLSNKIMLHRQGVLLSPAPPVASWSHLRLGLSSNLAIPSGVNTDVVWSDEVSSTNWGWTASSATATVPAGVTLVIASFGLFPSVPGSAKDTAVSVFVNSVDWARRSNDNQYWINQNNRVFLPVVGGDTVKIQLWVNSVTTLLASEQNSFLDLQGFVV